MNDCFEQFGRGRIDIGFAYYVSIRNEVQRVKVRRRNPTSLYDVPPYPSQATLLALHDGLACRHVPRKAKPVRELVKKRGAPLRFARLEDFPRLLPKSSTQPNCDIA